MVSEVGDPEKIEAKGIKHIHTGQFARKYLIIELVFRNGQL